MYPTTDLSTITCLRDAFEANVTTLAIFLSLNKLASAAIEYSGSGDSGDYESSAFLDGSGNAAKLPSGVKLRYVAFQKAWMEKPDRVEEQSHDPESFFSLLLDQAISVNNHDGWENGDGGGGTCTVNADGTFSFSHFDNVVTQEYDEDEGDFSERVSAHLEANRLAVEKAANASFDALQPVSDQPFAVCV